MTCPICSDTGMVRDTPTHDYRFGVVGWTRCTCRVREPPPPAFTLSQLDDQIAAMRAVQIRSE